MTVLNRNQLHGMRRNILELGLCEMAKCRVFTSKASACNAVNKHRCLGTATQDKCETTHALPGPISSLIEMEHKFSVSRTQILLSWDGSWLMVWRHFLDCPCWLDWQVGTTSPHAQWMFKKCKIETYDLKVEWKACNNCKNNWCLGVPENWKLVHWWGHPAINVIHYERLGATIDPYRIAFRD